MSSLPDLAKQKPLAAPGIVIEAIGLKSCRFDDHLYDTVFHPDSASSQEAEATDENSVDVKAEVNVFFRGDEAAVVELAITAQPKSQPTWSANVVVFGDFSVSGIPAIPLNRFVWNNGIAYLVPFARERLASLTGASIYQSYFLPPLSVPAILALAGMLPAVTTPAAIPSPEAAPPPHRRRSRKQIHKKPTHE